MPIKKDEKGKRWVEMEFLAHGTPEEVWQAMATGPGNTAWFTRATIEERVGGALRFEFGPDASSSGEVTIWEPPRRFGYVEREWMEGAPPVATEITIESRAGGQCVVRMVHSLFTSSDDWDDQMEGFESGWPGFFEVLRIYLRHFAGQQCASFQIMAPGLAGDDLAFWHRLTNALSLSGANVGERRANASKPEPFSGIVEHVHQDGKVRFVIVCLDAPGPGTIIVGTYRSAQGVHVSMTAYYYGDEAAEVAQRSESAWREWFRQSFPTDQAS